MAPRQREPSVERTEEYDKFIEDLGKYHEKRGTNFDPEPRVGPRHLDLFRLYKRVIEEGGYDRVSDTKGNKLAWRKIATDFLPGSANVVQLAFQVKTAYYKNLAAYEISTFHKKEPPPKEILEDVTAKGGNLLNRTIENYTPRVSREAENLVNGDDDSDMEQKTPGQDRMDVDEPGSTGGRVTRGLRHNPPQRALFGQPDMSARQTRSSTHQGSSPTPGINGAGVTGAALSIMNYEPVSLAPSSVKPIQTPANDAKTFRDRAAKMLAAQRSRRGFQQKRMAPGSGFAGPTIYTRTLFALQSGVPEEVQYGLHHLVKISHERGDKYRFDQFTGLAEALIEKVLEVSTLYYGFKWRITYRRSEDLADTDMLNALSGTPDLLEKIKAHRTLGIQDDLLPENFSQLLNNINEAGLVLRNMVIMDENAWYLARMPIVRDMISIVLQLPSNPHTVELQHYVLELAEQLTKYFVLNAKDPLYISLLAQLTSDDRGTIITSLRALSRIAMNYSVPNRLPNVPIPALRRICDWLLVEDEELRIACLDFLYMFTAETDNVKILLKHLDMEALTSQLVRGLMHGAVLVELRDKSKSVVKKSQGAEAPPKLSKSIVEQLCQITDEKEQSAQWLQTCFEADDDGEITQLALWSAYNDCFSQAPLKRPLMAAKDFITNVSSTFKNAQAQVVPNYEDPKRPKYTIKGVRPRAVPVDSRGRPYLRCLWRTPVLQSVESTNSANGAPKDQECDLSVAKPEEMWEHIVSTHLGIPKDPETGKFTLHPPGGQARKSTEADGDAAMADASDHVTVNGTAEDEEKMYSCHWSVCTHFPPTGIPDAVQAARHIATHLPDTSPLASVRRSHNRDPDHIDDLQPVPLARHRTYWNTATDEHNEAAGMPLVSVLVLRNLALQMGRIDKAQKEAEQGMAGMGFGGRPSGAEERQREGWVEKCFLPHRERLMEVLALNLSLTTYLGSLLARIDRAMERVKDVEGEQ